MVQPIKIYVGNIPQSARNSELKELFEKFGKVVECDILKEFAFVHMDDTNDAKAAIAGLNDSLWKGARIRVELSTTKTSKGEPSLRHKYPSDDLSRSLRRRSYERDFRDRRGSPPPHMRNSAYARDLMRDRFNGPISYRSSEMRGPIRDSRYASGPTQRSRPYPGPYDRRPYPEPRGGPLPPRGGYIPEYPFHPSSYRAGPELMRDHRGLGGPGSYGDPYGRQSMHYAQPMPYYRGPPQMSAASSRYDYAQPHYASSRPSRYSPPVQLSSRSDPYREKDYRDMSPPPRRPMGSFNDHRERSPRHLSPAGLTKNRRQQSSYSRSLSPVLTKPRVNQRKSKEASYSRSPSPLKSRDHHKNKKELSSSRSPSPVAAKSRNGHHKKRDESYSPSPSPVLTKSRNGHHKAAKEDGSKVKGHPGPSSESSSNNSSFNETKNHRRTKLNGYAKHGSVSPISRHKKAAHKRVASSSASRSRSRSSNPSLHA